MHVSCSKPAPAFEPQLLSQKGSLFFTRPTLFHYTLTPALLLPTPPPALPMRLPTPLLQLPTPLLPPRKPLLRRSKRLP